LLNISTGEIIDLCGAKKDLKAGIIKTTSDPQVIFNDDPLRIIRAVRFASKLGFRIELNTYNAIRDFSTKLEQISKERIREEFMKILESKDYVGGIKYLLNLNLIGVIGLPELYQTQFMEQNKFHTKDVFGHILDVMNNTESTGLHRLAALLHDIGKVNTRTVDDTGVHFFAHEIHSAKIAERFMTNLKFSSDDIKMVVTAVKNHMRLSSDISNKKIRQIRSQLGDEQFTFLLDLCAADRLSHTDKSIDHINAAREIKNNEVNITTSNLLVDGNDIQELFGIKPGPQIGHLISVVSDLMFNNPAISREEIIAELKTHI